MEKTDRSALRGHDHGILSRKVAVYIAEGKTRKLNKKEIAEYKEAVDQYLAFVGDMLDGLPKDSPEYRTFAANRASILSDVIAFDRVHGTWRHALGITVGIRAREFIAALSPKVQKRIMDSAIVASLGFSLTVRTLAVGPAAAVMMVAAAFGGGRAVRAYLNKQAESGGTNFFTRWILNTKELEAAEADIAKAHAAYEEKERHDGVRRIAKALKKKRSALLGRQLSIMMAGSVTGWGSGMGALHAADTLGIHNFTTGAEAAMLHQTDGTVKELPTTGDQMSFYDRLMSHDGWFVVKNRDGTYNVFKYDAEHGVRFAVGGVKNLSELNEQSVIEITKSELGTMTLADRDTVLTASKSWDQKTPWQNIQSLLGLDRMSEEEIRDDNIYSLAHAPSYEPMDINYWTGLKDRIGTFLATTGRRLQEAYINSSRFGKITFESVFIAGKPGGLSDTDIFSIYRLFFDRIEAGVDLNDGAPLVGPSGEHMNRIMMSTTFDSDATGTHVHGYIDSAVADLPNWFKAWLYGHEIGHALCSMGTFDEALMRLPVADREHVLREMHDYFNHLKHMRAEGMKTNFKGWPESLKQLVAINENPNSTTDTEIFADLFSKMLTNPEEVRTGAPEFYTFVRDMIDSDPKLRAVVGIV